MVSQLLSTLSLLFLSSHHVWAAPVTIPDPSTSLSRRDLNPSCAPGGNFDLTKWQLQLPSGSNNNPDTKTSSDLKDCGGFSDKNYFFTDSAGAMVTKVPGSPDSSGCVSTPNSRHCRTELRETSPGSWDPTSGTNTLSVTTKVVKADNSDHGTVIGQIHIDDSVSSKPVCELYYNSQGAISMGVEQTRSGGNEKFQDLGQVDVGTQFSYQISYSSSGLTFSLNNGDSQKLDASGLNNPKSYFKVGNYNQGSSESEVHFYSISTQH